MSEKKAREHRSLAKAATAAGLAGAVLAGGFAGTAMADSSLFTAEQLAAKQTLTVESSRDLTGSEFKAVMLAQYSAGSYDGDVITGFDVRDAGHAAAINTALVNAGIDLTANGSDQYKKYDASNPMAWVVENLLDSTSSPFAGQLRNFLTELNRAGLQNGADAVALPVAGKTATGQVTPGVYAVFDTTAQTREASIPMLNGTGINGMTTMTTASGTYTLGTVEYKYTDPSITKTITDAGQGSVAEGGQTAAAQIGDVIEFELATSVPNWTGYDKFHFDISDTMGEGLKYKETKSVMIGDTEIKDMGNKVAVTGTDGQTVVWTLGENANIAGDDLFEPFADIKIVYTATLDKDAEVYGNEQGSNVNQAEITWSNNVNHQPGTNGAGDPGSTDSSESNTVEVVTGAIEITKTDTSDKPLAGAEFEITRDTDGSKVAVVDLGNGSYRVADGVQDQTTTTTLVSPASGVITVTGMDASYTVKETKSPLANFQLPDFTVNVLNDQTNGEFTASLDRQDANKLVTESETNDHGFIVRNVRNLLEMPKTGATWMMMFITGALASLGGAMALLKRRDMTRDQQ